MTGNGIESDFVLPDSLFISDYSTLPSFYPHFGANCRFFCTISMSPDSSTPFASRTRGAASGLRQRVFDPLDSLSRDLVGDIFLLLSRVAQGFRLCGGDQRAFRSPFGNLRCTPMLLDFYWKFFS